MVSKMDPFFDKKGSKMGSFFGQKRVKNDPKMAIFPSVNPHSNQKGVPKMAILGSKMDHFWTLF